MNPRGIWSALEASFDFLGGYGYPAMDETSAELGLTTSWFNWVAAIALFWTEPFTTAHLQPIPAEPFQRLIGYLYRLAEAAQVTLDNPPHPLLSHKRNLRKIEMTALINQFERYVSELSGYRDDAYASAWQARRVEGHAWEAFDQ